MSVALVGYFPRVVNMGLRGLALISRFFLIFLLAKTLEPDQVGQFGLFAATVAFSVLLIGGDFYIYSQRELLSGRSERWSFILQHQALAACIVYLIALPLQALWFYFDLLPRTVSIWFFVLLVGEHLAQEVNRLLIALQRPVLASAVLLLRSGVWVWIAIPILWYYPEFRSLDTVYKAWCGGVISAFVIGAFVVYRTIPEWRLWKIDPLWIIRGFKVASLFLFATLCLRALFTIDRYAVEYLTDDVFLGVYVFFIGIAMAVSSFLDASVIAFLYPRMVSAFRKGKLEEYKSLQKEMRNSVFIVGVILILTAAAITPLLLGWIGRPVYQEFMSTLWMLLIMALAYNIALIPHYSLYAIGDDRGIMLAHISSLVVFIVVTFAMSSINRQQAVPSGLIAAFLWMGGVKSLRNRNHKCAANGSEGNRS